MVTSSPPSHRGGLRCGDLTLAKVDVSRLPDWPRLLSGAYAAAYLGISPGHLVAHVTVQPVRLGTRVLYDRAALDRFVDALSGYAAVQPVEEYNPWDEGF